MERCGNQNGKPARTGSEEKEKSRPDYEWSDLRPNLDLYTIRLDYVNDDTYVLDYRWRKGI